MNDLPEELLLNISEYLYLDELFILSTCSKNLKSSLQIDKKTIESHLDNKTFDKNFSIKPLTAYHMINSYVKSGEYPKISSLGSFLAPLKLSLSSICDMDLKNAVEFINFANDNKQYFEISPLPKYYDEHYDPNKDYILFDVAKWAYGRNLELFMYCVRRGINDPFITYLFNEEIFLPTNSIEEEIHYSRFLEYLSYYYNIAHTT